MSDKQIKQRIRRAFDDAAPELSGIAPLPRSIRKEPTPSRQTRHPALRWSMAGAAAVLVFFCGFAVVHGLRAQHTADAFPAAASLQEPAPAATPSPKVVQAALPQEPVLAATPSPEPIQAALPQEPVSNAAAAVLAEDQARWIILGHANVAAQQVQRWYMKLDRENGRSVYEAEFTADGYEYEYEIDAATGQVLKNEREQLRPAASDTSPTAAPAAQDVGQDQALSIALRHAGVQADQAQQVRVEKGREDGRTVYEVDFTAGGYEYEYEIDAVTGEVLKHEREKVGSASQPTAKPTAATGSQDVGRDQALSIALRHAGVQADQAQQVRVEKDREDGRTVYEVDFTAGGYEYEYEIDAATGEVLKHEKEKARSASKPKATSKPTAKPTAKTTSKPTAKPTEAPQDTSISRDQALSIALRSAGVKSSDARKVKVEKDREDGRTVYEVEFTAGGYEYEYEIDASSGRVLSRSKERDD